MIKRRSRGYNELMSEIRRRCSREELEIRTSMRGGVIIVMDEMGKAAAKESELVKAVARRIRRGRRGSGSVGRRDTGHATEKEMWL